MTPPVPDTRPLYYILDGVKVVPAADCRDPRAVTHTARVGDAAWTPVTKGTPCPTATEKANQHQ